MAKAAKTKSIQQESKHEDDDTLLDIRDDPSETVVDPDEPPPVNSTDAYGEGPDGPDVDYLPDGAAKSDSVSAEELKILHEEAERLRRPLSFMKCDETSNYTIKTATETKNVTGSKLLAILDWMFAERTLFIKGKGVQTKGHKLSELKGKPPPRPNSYNDRSKWAQYHDKGKEVDPFGNVSKHLPFKQSGGGIVVLQVSASVRRTAGDLLASFDGKRPIVELTREADPDLSAAGATRSLLKILGYEKGHENFDYLREMLLRDDPDVPEPKDRGVFGDE